MTQWSVLAVMPMPNRLRKANSETVGADIVDRPFFEQAMIRARSDRNALAGAPVNRLRQAQRVATRDGAITQRDPRRTRFTVQIDSAAIEGRQKFAAQLRMD